MSRIRLRHPSPPRIFQESRAKQRRGKGRGAAGWLGRGRNLFWSWWIWIAAAVALEILDHQGWAVGCASAGFFFYLVAPHEHVPVYGLESSQSVDSPEFLANVAGACGVPVVPGNRLCILNNGDEFYPAMLQAISGARKTVTMEAYIYWKGEIGLRFANAFAAKRQEGIEVKLLLDAMGSATIGKEILAILKNSGCDVVWFNPLRLRTLGHYNNRTHRKSLVVDGRIAFTGGAGIADHWKGNATDPQHWRDIQVSFEGPAALGLQTGFAQNWLNTTGELIAGDGYFPKCPKMGNIGIQTILSTPNYGSSPIRIMYYLSIVSARETIFISNPYFIPDDSAVEILIEAKKRGVDVKVMVAGIYNDMRVSRYSSIHLYGKLLKAGIEIYEYNRTMLHQKTMVVDGVWSTIGTTNFDNRSFALNEESNISVHDRDLAKQLEYIFFTDLQDCQQVHLQSWSRRGWKTRILGAVCVFIKQQT